MGVKVDFKVNVPHGEMDITENGQYDVSDYAIANVNIAFETEEKSVTITENGTQEVLPSVGKDALSKVVINTEIPIKEEQSKNVEIKENGTISVLPDEGKVLNEVSITTNVPQLDTSKVDNMKSAFYYCNKLTTIPLLDTSNVTSTYQMFSNCSSLTTVPALNVDKVTRMNDMFGNCINLKSILMTNIGANLNIASSTKFEREDLLTILNNLKTVTSSQRLTMGATNLAKLTDEDKAIATNKGWTLA